MAFTSWTISVIKATLKLLWSNPCFKCDCKSFEGLFSKISGKKDEETVGNGEDERFFLGERIIKAYSLFMQIPIVNYCNQLKQNIHVHHHASCFPFCINAELWSNRSDIVCIAIKLSIQKMGSSILLLLLWLFWEN